MAKDNFVNSLKKGLNILETFTPENPKLKLQELTLLTGLPKTTVFRLLHTLTALNYVRFETKTREYFLGPKVMSLGYATLAGLDLREISKPYLEELSDISTEYVSVHPNAGMPNELGEYDDTPAIMAQLLLEFAQASLINIVGGCCGSTPEHMKEIIASLKDAQPRRIS
jgi:hypothetical protein